MPPHPLPHADAVVIGGGFYGARLALVLRRAGRSVVLVEREPELLARASLCNQARVHGGYHYPRSILTSLRSRQNYARFLTEYEECADRSFAHYYAIARRTSKVTASQFAEFCHRIGAPLAPAPKTVTALFDSTRIEAVFAVEECAFNAATLRQRMTDDLRNAGVDIALCTEVVRVSGSKSASASVTLRSDGELREIASPLVVNCTYSRLNQVLAASGVPAISMKHELTEMALVEPPRELGGAAVTVMDGPFFSLMPYPSRGLFTLSHVRYTPHANWHDAPHAAVMDGDALRTNRATQFTHMMHDAARYLPVMRGARYVDSIFEIKTIMPRSEQDDSRPILLRRSAEIPQLVSVLGAKIDSVYDVEEAMALEMGAIALSSLAPRPALPAPSTSMDLRSPAVCG